MRESERASKQVENKWKFSQVRTGFVAAVFVHTIEVRKIDRMRRIAIAEAD
jgi:hypothetical protein